jgi:hypothetical protein
MHVRHTVAAEAPTTVEYVPFLHLAVHKLDVRPWVEPYLPAGQLIHESIDSPPNVSLYLPAGQRDVHTVAPSKELYLPLGHKVQARKLGFDL